MGADPRAQTRTSESDGIGNDARAPQPHGAGFIFTRRKRPFPDGFVGNWQFDRSGPRFSWFDTGLVSYTTEATLSDGFSGTGEVQAIVVSNTGRTGDTIVGMGGR